MNEFIYRILSQDNELCSLLGKLRTADNEEELLPAIHHGYAKTWESVPSICFTQKDCSDEVFADDYCFAKKYTYEFDLFFEQDGYDAYRRMDYVLRENGFFCKSSRDILEPVGRRINSIYYFIKEE